VAYFKVLALHFLGRNEKSHENSQSEYPIPDRIGTRGFRMRNRSANLYTTKIDIGKKLHCL